MKQLVQFIITVSVVFFLLLNLGYAEPCTEGLIRAMKEAGLNAKQIKIICEKAKSYDRVNTTVGQRPNFNKVKNYVQTWLQEVELEGEPLNNIYQLVSCEKTNGYEIEKNSYALEYKGSLKLLRTVYHGWWGITADSKAQKQSPAKIDKKGNTIPITGTVIYQLTENGWRKKDFTLKGIQ